MNPEIYKMSVRGSKNKIIIYIAGACSIAFAILLYHNASKRLEAMEISYERCNLNEESLSAQLQVNLEYKIRLEKSLQQEKSDHAQTKEEFQKKLEDDKHIRERESLEYENKLNALKEQYNFIQHQYDVVRDNYEKLRQLQLSEGKDKKHLEEIVENLKKELKFLRENRVKDADNWKEKLSVLENENSVLQEESRKLREKIQACEKIGINPTNRNLPNNMQQNPLFKKGDGNESQLRLPNLPRSNVSPSSSMAKSSTVPNKIERDLFPSANSLFANISTPMINPQAVQSDDKIPIAPMPQPRQESSPMRDNNLYVEKDNVGPKPEQVHKDNQNIIKDDHDIRRGPDLFNQFDHVPQIHNYRKQVKESERNNHAGEVVDEEEPLVKNVAQNQVNHWRESDFRDQQLAVNPVGNEIPRNPAYHYQVEEDGRKEEIEDDDDLDPADYQNDKVNEEKENALKPVIQIPFDSKHDSVMLQPK